MKLPLWMYKIEFGENDIRFNYDLAGTTNMKVNLSNLLTRAILRRYYHGRRLLHDQCHEVTLQ